MFALAASLVLAPASPRAQTAPPATAPSGTAPATLESLGEADARALDALLARAAAAEEAGRFADAVVLYREASAVLPLEEFRLGEAYCLERAGDVEAALRVWTDLTASSRAEIRAVAVEERVRLGLALAGSDARDRVAGAAEDASRASAVASPDSEAPARSELLAGEPADAPGSTPWGAIASAASAGATLALGATLLALSEAREHDLTAYLADPSATGAGAQALRDQSDRLGAAATVSFALAGALAATALVLWLSDDADGATVAPAIGAGGGGAVVRVPF